MTVPRTTTDHLRSGTAVRRARPPAGVAPSGVTVLSLDLEDTPHDRAVERVWTARGHEVVSVSRDTHGWDFRATFDDVHEVVGTARGSSSPPDLLVAYGVSLGGLVARLLVERQPVPVAGGLAVDGGGAGILGLFNTGLDMARALRGVTGASTASTADPGTVAELCRRLAADPAGRARMSLVAALGTKPPWPDPAVAEPAPDDLLGRQAGRLRTLALDITMSASLRPSVEAAVGGSISGDAGYDHRRALQVSAQADEVAQLYADAGIDLDHDLDRIAGAETTIADPDAVDRIGRLGQVYGQLGAPLVTLKSPGDPGAVWGEDTVYAGLVDGAGRTGLLRQLQTSHPGHVAQSVAEKTVALDLLLARIDSGEWDPAADDPAELNGRARALRQQEKGAWGTRRSPVEGDVATFLRLTHPVYPRWEQGRLTG